MYQHLISKITCTTYVKFVSRYIDSIIKPDYYCLETVVSIFNDIIGSATSIITLIQVQQLEVIIVTQSVHPLLVRALHWLLFVLVFFQWGH